MSAFEVPRQALDVLRTARLRHQDSIATKLGGYTRQQFEQARRSGEFTPVIIPAHNEAADLPACLAALARNGNVLPIVGANRCNDDTADIARSMGAIVVDVPKGRKMGATQQGMQFVTDELKRGTMLLTDADTLPGPRWASTVTEQLSKADQGDGAVFWGNSLSLHQERFGLVDLALCLNGARHTLRAARGKREPIARGHNWGVSLDQGGRMQAAINQLDPSWFVGPEHDIPDDTMISQVLDAETDAASFTSTSPDTWVITRNDRVNTLHQVADLMLHRATYGEVASDAYTAQYRPAA